jgi:hypothetical protein
MIESILLRHLHTIEEVALQLINSDELIKKICRRVYEFPDQFDLVAIQLVRSEEGVIETVAGEGMAEQWAGRIGHYLVQDQGLRDIQADVVCMWNIELVEGSDPRGRFDSWVYKYYGHEGLKRAFLPIVVARNAQGAIMKAEEWCKHIRFDLDPLDEQRAFGFARSDLAILLRSTSKWSAHSKSAINRKRRDVWESSKRNSCFNTSPHWRWKFEGLN